MADLRRHPAFLMRELAYASQQVEVTNATLQQVPRQGIFTLDPRWRVFPVTGWSVGVPWTVGDKARGT